MITGGVRALAIGEATTASGARSIAIGDQATATRDNQVAIGTATNTCTLPGVTSAASTAAQTGPTMFVTSDAGGNLATDSVATSGNVARICAAIGSINSRLDGFRDDVESNRAGIALALALDAPSVPSGQSFAISGGLGTIEGESAMAVSFTAQVNPNVSLNVGVGSGFTGDSLGGRAGAVYSW